MSIVRSIFADAALMTGSTAFARGLSFLSLVMVTHAISRHDYGVFTLALAVVGPGLTVVSLGLDDAVVADASRAITSGAVGTARRLISSYVRVRLAVLCLVIVSGWFLRGMLSDSYGPAVADDYWGVAAIAVFQHLRNTVQLLMQVGKNFRGAAALMGGEQVARIVLVLGFFIRDGITVPVLLGITAASAGFAVCAALPSLWRFWSTVGKAPPDPQPVLRTMLRTHGMWQILQAMTSDVFGALKYYLIYHLLSAEAVAITAIAQSIFSTATSLFPIKFVLFPHLAQAAGDRPRMQQTIDRVGRYAFSLYSALMIAVLGGGAAILYIFFPAYHDAIPFLAILCLRLPYNAWSLSQSSALTIFKKQRFNVFVTMTSGITMCFFLFITIRLWGVTGIAAEGLATVGLVLGMREVYLRRVLGIRTMTLFTLRPPHISDIRRIAQFLLQRVSGRKLTDDFLPSADG